MALDKSILSISLSVYRKSLKLKNNSNMNI